MKTIRVMLDDLPSTLLEIGRVGENEHTQVVINCIGVYADYPSALAAMAVQNPAGEVYPAVIETSGAFVVWTVCDSDLTQEGGGRLQLTFTDDEEIIKTVIGNTNVLPSLGPTGSIPTPVENWLDQAGEKLAEVDAWNNAEAEATSLAAGASPTATITEEEGHKLFTFGIPAGQSGVMVEETVTGTTPSITGVSNHRYVCGEVSTISITPPSSGIIDVVFESGTTPAVLTATGVTFPAWFDSTSLEASVTYEICIADGMGVVAKWA